MFQSPAKRQGKGTFHRAANSLSRSATSEKKKYTPSTKPGSKYLSKISCIEIKVKIKRQGEIEHTRLGLQVSSGNH